MPRGYDIFDQADIERRLLPPSTAIRGYNNLVLFLAGSGIRTTESIIDISPTTKPLTLNGGVTISNTQADPYGTNNGVLAFNGTDAQIKCFDFDGSFQLGGSGSDFTIGFWVYFNSLSSASQYLPIATTWENAVTAFAGKWFIGLFNGSLRWFNDAGNVAITDSATPLATWVNYMVVRSGSTITLYKNGIAIGTQTTAQNYFGLLSALDMGFVTSGGAYLNAFIYNFRIFKGAAIQTTNFPLMTRTQVEAQIATAAFNVNNRRAFSNRVLGFNSEYVNRPFLAGDGVNPQLWSPIQLSPALWLDAADSSTITIATGVSQWNDKSGNGRNVSQSTPAAQPAYTANALNGLPVVAFDASNDTLFNTSAALLRNLSGATIIMIARKATLATSGFQIYIPTSTGGGRAVYLYNSGGITGLQVGGRRTSTDSLQFTGNSAYTSNYEIQVGRFDYMGADLQLWLNGTLNGQRVFQTSGVTDNDAGALYLGSSGSSSFVNAQIGEALIYNSALSTNNREIVEGYLAWKWGLQASLPANHPYRNSPPTTNV